MSFDMNPADEDPHGECRHEIHALKAEVERLRNRLLTAGGDDLCRLSQEEIKAMGVGAVKIPPKGEFLASCERFHDQMANEVGVATNCLTLAQLVAENERLRKALVGLVGADTKAELEQMEAVIRIAPVPDVDRMNTINAIQALLQTL